MEHTIIQDPVGRTVIGKVVAETDTTLTLNNPVFIHCQPDQSGQLHVQSFPVLFFEFIDKNSRDQNDWTYAKASIVTSNVKVDEKILSQYEKINTPADVVSTKNNNPKVISIDDL